MSTNYRLKELIDIKTLQTLQENLDEIYSFPSAIIDNDGEILTAVAWQDICTKFHRKHPECEKECIKSDQYIQSHLHEANPCVSYKCPQGLIDNAAPIIIEGQHVGNFFTGQFFLEKPNLDFFKKQARKYGFDEKEYLEAVAKVPIWSKQKIEKYFKFISGFLQVIAQLGLKGLKEKEFKSNLYRFSALVENLQSGVFYINTLGEILEVNNAMLKLLGSPSKDDTQKINIFKFQPLVDIGYATKLEECIKSQKIVSGEAEYVSKWGKKAIIAYYFVPIIENGVVVGVLANNEDYTEKRKAEKKIRESSNFTKALLNAIPTAVFYKDLEGKYLGCNRIFTEIMGVTSQEIKGKTVFELWPTENAEIYHKKDLELLKEPQHQIYESAVTDKNGNKRPVIYTKDVFYDEQGNVAGIVGAFLDITERKKVEEELKIAKEKAEEANRLKTEFLNNMSHEIRTPLNGIIGFSEMLYQPDIPQDERRYFYKIVQNSSQQLLRIIDDILDISTLEAKQEKINETEFCLNDLLMELFSVFNLKSKERNIPIYIKKALHDNESYIFTDKTKLLKILSNLMENSIKFTDEGYIELGYLIEKSELKIYVKDTGIGISSENHKIIFERFSQEEKQMSRKYGGLGLGLSISKENAQLLGGDILLESEKGKGSTFYVSLPLKPTQKNTDSKSQITSLNNEGDRYTILIAEDEEINYLYIEVIFEKEGHYNIIHAKNGLEALEICEKNQNINLVLMDIKMPIMNGLEATEKIKEKFPDLPIIAQTAYSTEKDKQLALKHGCDEFISKPIKKEVLFEMINKLLKK